MTQNPPIEVHAWKCRCYGRYRMSQPHRVECRDCDARWKRITLREVTTTYEGTDHA